MGSGGGGLKCFLGNPSLLDSLFSDGNPSFGVVSFDGSPSLLLRLTSHLSRRVWYIDRLSRRV